MKDISTLYDEYETILGQYRKEIDHLEKTILEADAKIKDLQMNRKASYSVSYENNLRVAIEINDLISKKEMSEEKLRSIKCCFTDEGQRRTFLSDVQTAYQAEEDSFISTCVFHIDAMIMLMDKLNETTVKANVLMESLGEVPVIKSDKRQLIEKTLSELVVLIPKDKKNDNSNKPCFV